MKNIFLSFALLFFTTISVNAQLKEGHLKYKIDFSTSNAEMEPALAMMQGSTLELYFKDADTRTEMKMGAIMTLSTITNAKTEDYLVLMSGMMGNKAVKSTLTELEETNPEKPEFEVVFMDETKTIEGYVCKKAVLTNEDGLDAVFWYTEDIIVNKSGQQYLSEEIPGFPLEFEINQGEMKMHLVATLFEKKIGAKSKEIFSMDVPEGYELMTIEQLTSMGM
jgi:GLPGLI family protein